MTATLGDAAGKVNTTKLYRLATSTGALTALRASPPWSPSSRVNFTAAAANGSGDFYTTGSFTGSYDFGAGCGTATAAMGSEFFLAKYSTDGSQCRWLIRPTIAVPARREVLQRRSLRGRRPGVRSRRQRRRRRPSGRPGARLHLHGSSQPRPRQRRGRRFRRRAVRRRTRIRTCSSPRTRRPAAFVWATQISMILMGNLRAMNVDRQNNVVVSGTYTGSMQVDNRLLVDTVPELVTDAGANTYLASFAPPSAVDQTPPVIGAASDAKRRADRHDSEADLHAGHERGGHRGLLHASDGDRRRQRGRDRRRARRPPTRRSRSARRWSPAPPPIGAATSRARRSRSRWPTASARRSPGWPTSRCRRRARAARS